MSTPWDSVSNGKAASGVSVREAPPTIQWAPLPTAPFDPVSALDLINTHPELRSPVIEGLLREGEVMNLVAAPKVGKSWLAHSLLMGIITGRPWLGMPTRPGAALLIDAELHHETLGKRLSKAASALGAGNGELSTLSVWSVRGRRLTIDAIASQLSGVEQGRYRVIVFDALYRFMPENGEENSNETMTRVYNTLDAIADRTGASVVVVHHASKGNQAERAVTDVGSGAGAQSRAADTHLVLRNHEEEGAVVVDAVARSWPPPKPYALRWCDPGWELAPELDPSLLRATNRRGRNKQASGPPAPTPRVWTPEEFAQEIVGPKPVIRDEIIARCEGKFSKTQGESLLNRALVSGVAHRWKFGPSDPHRFACVPQQQDLPTDRGEE